jgi:hypothetical protein
MVPYVEKGIGKMHLLLSTPSTSGEIEGVVSSHLIVRETSRELLDVEMTFGTPQLVPKWVPSYVQQIEERYLKIGAFFPIYSYLIRVIGQRVQPVPLPNVMTTRKRLIR